MCERKPNIQVVQMLLNHGADVNANTHGHLASIGRPSEREANIICQLNIILLVDDILNLFGVKVKHRTY